jgi:hypothetical protein
MNMIYAWAIRLTIWLGPAADESDLAMYELRNLGVGALYKKMPILSGRVLRAVEKLLNRRWWFRIWIVQEVFWGGAGVKLNKIRVGCGKSKVLD